MIVLERVEQLMDHSVVEADAEVWHQQSDRGAAGRDSAI
jgi:hypothetical protein